MSSRGDPLPSFAGLRGSEAIWLAASSAGMRAAVAFQVAVGSLRVGLERSGAGYARRKLAMNAGAVANRKCVTDFETSLPVLTSVSTP